MRSAVPPIRRGAAFLFACILLLGLQPVAGQGRGLPAQLTPELVPESEIPDRVQGLLPMRRDEFNRLLQTLGADTSAPRPGQIEIERALYYAKLTAGQLIKGRAAWLLARHATVHAALPPHNLPLKSLRSPEAVVGIGGSDSVPAIFPTDRSLEAGWSLRPTASSSTRHRFELVLPRSSVNQIVIEAPVEWELRSTAGVVKEFDGADGDAALRRISSLRSTTPGRAWLIELGGITSLSVTLVQSDRVPANHLRQSLHYVLGESGVALQARLSFDGAFRELVIDVDKGLRISAATTDGVELMVRETGSNRVVLEIPSGLPPGRRVVEIAAIGPTELGKLVRLPGFRVGNAVWQQGDVQLEIPPSLELRSLVSAGFLETEIDHRASPSGGEVRELRAFREQTELQVHLEYPAIEVEIQTAAVFRLAEDFVTARQVSSARTNRGERFKLELQTPDGWIVDSLETIPATTLESLVTTGTGEQLHRLSLRQPVSPATPLQFVVQAHRRIQNGRLEADDLRPLNFLEVHAEKRFVSLLAEGDNQLRLFRDESLQRFVVSELPDEVRTLIKWPPGSVAFEYDPKQSSFLVQVRRQTPQFDARIEIEAIIEAGTLYQSFAILCDPQDSALSSVIVHLTRPGESPIVWSVDGDIVSSRILSPADDDRGERVEVTLRTPRVEPFTLHGDRQEPFSSSTQIALASVPAAESQAATIMIASGDGEALSVLDDDLKATLGPESQSAALPAARGYFRYDPTKPKNVSVTRIGLDGQPSPVWVWQCELNSWFDQSGSAIHHGRLDVENLGARQTTVKFPVGVRIERVAVNGEELPLTNSMLQRNSIDIPLPRRRRSCSIQIEYGSDAPRLGVFSTVQAPWPILTVPCLQRSWRVWLPPGYRPIGKRQLQIRNGDYLSRWDQRLLGDALVPSDFGPFDFSSANEWRNLLTFAVSETDQPQTQLFDDFHQAAVMAAGSPQTSNGEGWASYGLDLATGQSAQLRIVRSSVERAVGWVATLLTIAAFALVFPGRRRLLPYAMIITAGATLLAPADALLLVRGVFFGSVIASMYLVLTGRKLSPPTSNPRPAAVPIVLVLFAATMTSDSLAGQNSAAEETAGLAAELQDTSNQVVIPTDTELRPVGEVLYVAPPLYDFLHGGPAAADRAGVTIESARYEVVLSHRSTQSEPQVTSLLARYQVRSPGRESNFAVPFTSDQVVVAEATVDGRQVETVQRRHHLELVLPASGRALVEFKLIPNTERDLVSTRLGLRIPPVADARLSLRAPAKLVGLEIVSCLGARESNLSTGLRRAHLGPIDQLDIRWATDQTRRLGQFSAEMLSWLRIDSTSAELEFVCKIQVVSGNLATLRISADRPLIPQSIQVDESAATIIVEGGERQAIDVELPSRYTSGAEGVVRASFLIPGFMGFGNFRLPRISVAELTPDTDWLAISFPSDLDVAVESDQELELASELDLAAAWPFEAATPQVGYRLPDSKADLQIQVRPKAAKWDHKLESALSIGQRFAGVSARAEITVSQGYLLQQRVALPAGFKVDDVLVRQADQDRLLRWSAGGTAEDGAGPMTVFFKEPMTGEFLLEISGSLPVSEAATVEIPRFRLLDAGLDRQVVHLYRRADVDFSLGFPLQQSAEPVWYQAAAVGRYVGTISDAKMANAEPITIRPNRPELRAKLTTELVYQGEAWHAQVDLEVTAVGGFIDQIRLRVPQEWTQPIDVLPSMPLHLDSVAGMSGKVLTLRPPTAVSSTYQVRLKAELTSSEDQDFRAPDITLLDILDVDRYLVLPSRINDQDLDWNLARLRLVSPAGGARSTYQVVEPPGQAILLDTQRLTGAPTVHLADYYLSWKSDGSCRGVASFDIDPAGQTYCRLVLPEGSKLLQVTVDDLPASMALEGTRRWQIRLGSNQLPQQVVVLFAGQLDTRRAPLGGQVLQGPRLADLPVKRTLWTVETLQQTAPLRPFLRHIEVDPNEHTRRRLEAVSQLLRLSSSDVGAPNEYDAWRKKWLEREQKYREQLQTSGLRTRPSLVAAVSVANPTRPSANLVHKWMTRLQHGEFLHCDVMGAADSLIVNRQDWILRRIGVSIAILGAMLGFGALAWVYFRSPTCREWLVRWPHAIGVLAGILLWLLIEPSVVGWSLVVVFAVSSLRPIWMQVSNP